MTEFVSHKYNVASLMAVLRERDAEIKKLRTAMIEAETHLRSGDARHALNVLCRAWGGDDG